MKRLFSSVAALGLILSPGWAKADYDFTTIDAPGAAATTAVDVQQEAVSATPVRDDPSEPIHAGPSGSGRLPRPAVAGIFADV